MKKKEKIIVGLSIVCMILTVVLGYTYAYWSLTKEQTGVNVIESGCFEIEFAEANDIELSNAFPISDQAGLELLPYTFTITNTCDLWANYQINLETFDVESTQTRMSDSYVRANLKKGNKNVFMDTLKTEHEVTPTINNATNAYKLGEGTLKNGNVHTYNLRLWMDSGVTLEDLDSISSYFKSKISVTFTATANPFAEAGTLQKVVSSTYSSKLWSYKSNITEIEFQNKLEPITNATESWDVSTTNDGSVMAYIVPNESDSTTYKAYIQGKGGVKANPDSSYLFKSFTKLTTISGLEYLDTSNVTTMEDMFYYCEKLTTLDLSNFDTSNVTDMRDMFYHCINLKILNLSNFDTSKVTTMQNMFGWCTNLTSLDVSNFDTSKVTIMYGIFYKCENLTTLDLNNFDTSNVTNMSDMFSHCQKLTTLDLSMFETSNVTNMYEMFYNCKNLIELDISNFDTSKVTNMGDMFNRCNKLNTEIKILATSVSYDSMFIYAATEPGSQIKVYHTSENESLVDSMIATKSATSNIIKEQLAA